MLLIIDTETGGFNPKINPTLTMGYMVVNDNFEMVTCGEIPINSGNMVVEKSALEVNNIDLEKHNKTALSEKQAIEKLNEVIEKYFNGYPKIAGHNIRFDIRFLSALYERNDSKFKYDYSLVCTMEFTRLMIAIGNTKLTSAKLDDIREYYGIKSNGKAHSALVDVIDTFEYLKMIKINMPNL